MKNFSVFILICACVLMFAGCRYTVSNVSSENFMSEKQNQEVSVKLDKHLLSSDEMEFSYCYMQLDDNQKNLYSIIPEVPKAVI